MNQKGRDFVARSDVIRILMWHIQIQKDLEHTYKAEARHASLRQSAAIIRMLKQVEKELVYLPRVRIQIIKKKQS